MRGDPRESVPRRQPQAKGARTARGKNRSSKGEPPCAPPPPNNPPTPPLAPTQLLKPFPHPLYLQMARRPAPESFNFRIIRLTVCKSEERDCTRSRYEQRNTKQRMNGRPRFSDHEGRCRSRSDAWGLDDLCTVTAPSPRIFARGVASPVPPGLPGLRFRCRFDHASIRGKALF